MVLWPICGIASKVTYLNMQPLMRLADEPKPGVIQYIYFFAAPLKWVPHGCRRAQKTGRIGSLSFFDHYNDY